MGAIAEGSALGGSLRYPAHACGLATIRPSFGRVPGHNPSGPDRPPTFQLMSSQGPLAREVRDVRLALSVMAGPDARDPWHTPAPLNGPRPAAPIKVAVTKTPAGIACHDAVGRAIDGAADHLANAGYAVEAVDPPLMAEIAACWRSLLYTDTKVMLEATMREHGSDDMKQILADCIAASDILDLEG